MARLGRFLKFPPSPAEIVSLSKVWLQPWREFRQWVRTNPSSAGAGCENLPAVAGYVLASGDTVQTFHDGPEGPLATR